MVHEAIAFHDFMVWLGAMIYKYISQHRHNLSVV